MILTGRSRLAGVMGWPVAHSRSPRLHGFWLERHQIDGAYVPLAVPPDRIGEALRALPVLGFRGANLTLPHKEAALAYLDEIDANARRLGAVNTVTVRDDGSLRGENTDGFGFLAHLRDTVDGWRAEGRVAVVLGAGGAARAIAAALDDDGARSVRVLNRTRARAEALAESLGGTIEALPWEERSDVLADADLLVNTTTLGMAGQPVLELDLSALPAAAVVYDIVYVPLETPLLKAARARGNPIVDGLGMLLHQARPGFEAWFGVKPAVDEDLRRFVLEDIAS